jgi:hypothetical protein
VEGNAMTQDEIQTAILQVCKVSGNDSDFNVLGFYTLCDRLVKLGAAAEREECAKLTDVFFNTGRNWAQLANAIRARGKR